MTARITETQKAWVAAILEVRGKVKRTDNPLRKTKQLRITVTNGNPKLIQRLCDITGTKPIWEPVRAIDPSAERRGCIEHCPEPHVHLATMLPAMGTWQMTGAGAAIVVENVAKYFIDDVELTLIAVEAIEALPKPNAQGSHAVKRTVERLRGLGWALPPELDEWMKGWPEPVVVTVPGPMAAKEPEKVGS